MSTRRPRTWSEWFSDKIAPVILGGILSPILIFLFTDKVVFCAMRSVFPVLGDALKSGC
jgi:hypothetical protein